MVSHPKETFAPFGWMSFLLGQLNHALNSQLRGLFLWAETGAGAVLRHRHLAGQPPAARRIPPLAWPGQLSWAARPTAAEGTAPLTPSPPTASLCLTSPRASTLLSLFFSAWEEGSYPSAMRCTLLFEEALTIQCCRYRVLLFSPLLIALLPVQSLKWCEH